jgi:predicted CXXCH cytochrome family protein
MKNVLLAGWLILAAGSALRAGIHPVPLDPATDAAKCLECHEAKTKGASVHTAMSGGCLSCHEIRVNREITRVKLTTVTALALCVSCHEDKKEANAKGKVHPPAARDCLGCHDPHVSANKYQLVKATIGEGRAENLCLQCHSKGLNVVKGGSRHAALDMGCDTCHRTHKTGDRFEREFAYHLAKPTPALCLECHDASDESLVKTHHGQPFAKADCIACHDPHQSASPKLMQKFLHSPFAEKSCEICHEPAQDGKVMLTTASSRELCVTCHESQQKEIDTAKVQHPGALGECIDCHYPHAGKRPGLPRPTVVTSCLKCHTEELQQGKKASPHQPFFEQGCAICHEPHGGPYKKILRTDKANPLCLECHGPDARPQKLEGTDLVTIFNGKVRLPEDYFNKVVRLPLKYGRGHPVEHHPVVDQMDPEDVTKVRTPLNCLTCHQNHASTQPGLLVHDRANGLKFCASCHKNLGG